MVVLTTPGGSPNPDVAYVWGSGSGYGQDITEASALAAMRGQALPGYADAQNSWHGLVSDLADLADEVEDEQLELLDRVDLLEGVHGYCNSFMSANWLVGQNQLLTLPFDTQLGPNVNAELFDDGIRLGTKGLWRADALVTFDAVSGANVRAEVYITVESVSGSTLYSETLFDTVLTSSGAASVAFSKTFVIPTDNAYVVKARVKHYRSARTRVFGGTLRSALSVNKWSSNTDNNVDIPVAPDGGDLG